MWSKPYCFLLGDRMLEIQARQHIFLCKLSFERLSGRDPWRRHGDSVNLLSVWPLCKFPPADGQALAEGLKSNGSLGWLELQNNNIGDRGAEAPAAGACLLVLGDLSDSLGSWGWRCDKKGQVIR